MCFAYIEPITVFASVYIMVTRTFILQRVDTMSVVSLDKLNVGQRGIVRGMRFSGADRRRMQDIGLINGTYVECLCKAASGDPAAYLIRGAVIAMRREDAAEISISVR